MRVREEIRTGEDSRDETAELVVEVEKDVGILEVVNLGICDIT